MKKAALVLLLSMFIPGLFSQTKAPANQKTHVSKNMALEFNAGYSMVLGNYGNSDTTNSKSGFAKGGWMVQFTFDWMGKRNFGLAFQYAFQSNPLNKSVAGYVPSGMNFPLGTGSWSNHYLMAGPVFLKSFNKLSLDVKILGGVILASSSNFNITNPTDSAHPQNVHGFGTGFAYQLSAGIGYAISEHFTLKFNLGISGGWPGKEKQYGAQLTGYVEYIDPVTGIKYFKPVYSAPREYTIKKVVTTLNPSLGLIFRF